MNKPGRDRFYLVQADILPEAIQKAVRAKELIMSGQAGTVNEAVEKVQLSRSAYYKYRDSVFPLHADITGKEITIGMTLEHRTGVLSRVLSTIAAMHGNILTINQEMPVQGLARVDISLDIGKVSGGAETLLGELKKIAGTRSVSLL